MQSHDLSLETVIDMGEQGYAVFPIPPMLKTPTNAGNQQSIDEYGFISVNWDAESTSDVAFIRENWPTDLPVNVGIDTGKSGVIVVDVDVKSGPGKQEWLLLLKHYGRKDDWPDTWTVETASGGLHFVFEAGDVEMRNSAGLLAKNIDIRAQGGYIVGWGSRTDKGEYRVINDAPPLPVPRWLVELEAKLRSKRAMIGAAERGKSQWALKMLSTSDAQAKIDALVQKLSDAGGGQRNALLHWTACRFGELAAAGRIDEETARNLCEVGCEQNGLYGYEVSATFRSGFARGYSGQTA